MRDYELVLIVHPDVDDEGFNGIIEQVGAQITDGGGQVTQVDTWGRRKLAYPIRKVREGQYVIMQTQLPREGIGELERMLKLTEPVMRHLLVRVGE